MKSLSVTLLAVLIILGLGSAQDTGGATGGDMTGGDAQIGGSLAGEGGMTGGDLEAAENITGGATADGMTGGVTGDTTGGMTGGTTVDEIAGGADDVTGGDLSGGDAASMVGPNGDMSGGDVTGGDMSNMAGDMTGGAMTGGDTTGGAMSSSTPGDLSELVSSYNDLGTLIERLESDTVSGAVNVSDETLSELQRIYGELDRMLEQVRGESN